MIDLVQKLQLKYPSLTFTKGETFRWSPSRREVSYIESSEESDLWSLLHEVSHALLDHSTYKSDIELLQKEVQAWEHAREISKDYDISIQDDFVEDCLDSYRDWLYKRSACPLCALQGIQGPSGLYSCLNCNHTWVVTAERFCRPYRRSQ